MKKFLLSAFAAMTISAPAHAFWNTPDFDKKDPSASYYIETKGSDIRVYEWVSAVNPNVICVGVFASMPVGQDCMEKTSQFINGFDTNRERVAPNNAFKVETRGFNVRVYEWTLQSDPGYSCSASFADAGVNGVACFATE
jgi:hypothetical protein